MGWRDAVPRGGRRVGWVRWARKAVRTWCYCEKKKRKEKKRKEKGDGLPEVAQNIKMNREEDFWILIAEMNVFKGKLKFKWKL
jgi:hypothetical protein